MITLGQATRIYAEMSWMRHRRGKMESLCLALLALPVVIAGGLAAAGQWGRGLFDSLLEIQFRFLIPFLPALLASSAVAEEIEERTFTFLFARPAPRSSLVLGKYLAIAVRRLRIPGSHKDVARVHRINDHVVQHHLRRGAQVRKA